MIAIEGKLNTQKHNVKHQKSQLEIMERLFKIQMEEFEEEGGVKESQGDQGNGVDSGNGG